MHWFYHVVRYALAHYGYWAVLAGLLLEDAGVPVPGEITLMLAAFIAHKTDRLSIVWVIVVGICAAVLGDNLGFWLGRHFGKTLVRWVKKIFRQDDKDIAAARYLIKLHGGATVFWARFIFGLRTIAGPLAGMLGMEWKRFFLFNALGGMLWVTVIAMAGYGFANEFNNWMSYFEKASWAVAAGVFLIGYFLWRHEKKTYKERHQHEEQPI